MKALTNINAPTFTEAVIAAREASAAGRAFAYSGGGTDLLQQIKDGTDQADVIINLRTVRNARAITASPVAIAIGGLITLSDLAGHASLPWRLAPCCARRRAAPARRKSAIWAR